MSYINEKKKSDPSPPAQPQKNFQFAGENKPTVASDPSKCKKPKCYSDSGSDHYVCYKKCGSPVVIDCHSECSSHDSEPVCLPCNLNDVNEVCNFDPTVEDCKLDDLVTENPPPGGVGQGTSGQGTSTAVLGSTGFNQ